VVKIATFAKPENVTSNDLQSAIYCFLIRKHISLLQKRTVKEKFRVEFMEEAANFLDDVDEKSREKILFNIWKSRQINDKELFKKLKGEIWEFRTLYQKTYFRLFAFWDKSDSQDTVVISTHGLIKKTGKIPNSEIEKAERLRINYFESKQKRKP
tara:strand:- start:6099 stop:6563 length:465 start_codon:yes stop_codon:yes gene_type:complete